MDLTVQRIICLAIGYIIGCVQTAFIVGKLMGKIDIRDFGSGNAGTTNVTRVLGAKAGVIVFVSDILKAVIAYCICTILFKGGGTFLGDGSVLWGIYAGVGVILGHDFPFYLKFKGGKGIASTLGLILCIDWRVALTTYIFGLVVVVAKKYIYLCSLVMVVVAPVSMVIFSINSGDKINYEAVALMSAIGLLAFYQHIPNIKRLIKGEENKFSVKKNK